MIPVVLKPRLLSLKNRWRNNLALRNQFGRDLILGSFSIAVMLSIYFGLLTSLDKIKASYDSAYLPPAMILGVILLLLFTLLLFSNCVSALGFLLLGSDLDLLMASPISRYRFFVGKFLEIVGSSTWMVLVFGAPVIIAFANSYGAPPFFLAESLFILIPFFCIPSALAIIAVLIFTSIVPANRTRELLVIVGGLLIVGVYLSFKLLIPESATKLTSITDFLNILQFLQLPAIDWSPSHWAAVALGERLDPTGIDRVPNIAALYGAFLFIVSLAYIAMRFLHSYAFSMAKTNTGGLRINSRQRQRILRLITAFMPPPFRALLGKEVSVFLRDMTQAVQLMLLLGLCAMYLYNLKVLRIVEQLPDDAKIWWQGFLVIANMAMGAFVIAAVCTRFVFPSISLEGQAYWVLRTSPLPLSKVLRAKFWIWLVPVATIGSVLLTSGAFAIRADPHIVIVSGLISWILCYGIVGLGVGLGAVYANFTWEHSSQLAASFGSLIYMIASTALIAINLIPATLIILMRSMKVLEHTISVNEWYISIGSCAALLIYLNYATARWALKLGENSLLEREKV